MDRREFLKGASAAAVATTLPVAAVLPSVEAMGGPMTSTEVITAHRALASEYRRQFIEAYGDFHARLAAYGQAVMITPDDGSPPYLVDLSDDV